MVPSFMSLRMPLERFGAPDGGPVDPSCEEEDIGDVCPSVPDSLWTRTVGKSMDVFVQADGPHGSGRFWSVTFGIGESGQQRPSHGCCFLACTLGWRTLQEYTGGAIPWVSDVDLDGTPELLIWDSFPLDPEASNAEYGLVVWVYRIASDTLATLDWRLSRQWARKLAVEYRRPLGPSEQDLRPVRERVAAALDSFAEDRCALDTFEVR